MITTHRRDQSPDLLMLGIIGHTVSLHLLRAMDGAHQGHARTGQDNGTRLLLCEEQRAHDDFFLAAQND